MSSTTSSFNKRTLSLNKKATLDPRQQFVFQSVDGHKLKPVVTEFSQIALAAPKEWPKKHQSYQHSSPADCHNSFSPKFTAPSKHTNIFDSTAPIMKEDTEMHLISKIQLTTFPLYLLASGCLCPCRV
ncbi:hypothetical protein BG004_005441 [Podila humilis]|nr:hypothetical protein BG004_005441 [Podila humilis]